MKNLIEENVKSRIKGEARKKVQRRARINKKGAEVLDPRPLFHDVGFKQSESMNDKIRRITMQVQSETAARMAAQNMSKEDIQRVLDDEDDFEIPEDYENTLTQYEAQGIVSELKEDVFLHAEQPQAEELEAPIVKNEDPVPTETKDEQPTA